MITQRPPCSLVPIYRNVTYRFGWQTKAPNIQRKTHNLANIHSESTLYAASRGQHCSSVCLGLLATAKKCTCLTVQGQSVHSALSFFSRLCFPLWRHLLSFGHLYYNVLTYFILYFVLGFFQWTSSVNSFIVFILSPHLCSSLLSSSHLALSAQSCTYHLWPWP